MCELEYEDSAGVLHHYTVDANGGVERGGVVVSVCSDGRATFEDHLREGVDNVDDDVEEV